MLSDSITSGAIVALFLLFFEKLLKSAKAMQSSQRLIF